jgi:hypothetical protein
LIYFPTVDSDVARRTTIDEIGDSINKQAINSGTLVTLDAVTRQRGVTIFSGTFLAVDVAGIIAEFSRCRGNVGIAILQQHFPL